MNGSVEIIGRFSVAHLARACSHGRTQVTTAGLWPVMASRHGRSKCHTLGWGPLQRVATKLPAIVDLGNILGATVGTENEANEVLGPGQPQYPLSTAVVAHRLHTTDDPNKTRNNNSK